MNEPAHRRRILRLGLCGAMLIASALFRLSYQFGSYWEGKHGFDDSYIWSGSTLMAVVGVAFAAAGAAAIGFVAAWIHELVASRRLCRKLIAGAIVFTVMVAAALFVARFQLRPANQYFLMGLAEGVEQRADLVGIKRWLHGLNAHEGIVPPSEWPPCVSDLSPTSVSVRTSKADRQVWLTWGGGFMHWGMAVRSQPSGNWETSGAIHRAIDDDSCVFVDAN